MMSLGKYPNVTVLHLGILELVLSHLQVVVRDELEDILNITLASFEAMHIIQGVRLIIDVDLSILFHRLQRRSGTRWIHTWCTNAGWSSQEVRLLLLQSLLPIDKATSDHHRLRLGVRGGCCGGFRLSTHHWVHGLSRWRCGIGRLCWLSEQICLRSVIGCSCSSHWHRLGLWVLHWDHWRWNA